MNAFEKGMGISLSESFLMFEVILGVAMFVFFFVVMIAAFLAWKSGKLNVGDILFRFYKGLILLIVFGVMLGVWR